MVANISPDPRLQFFANDGSPLVGGKLYTYAAGTTTPLATYTFANSTTASYTFTSIPQTYTDLVLVVTGGATSQYSPILQINSDTGTNYSATWLRGNGTAASSSKQSSSAASANYFVFSPSGMEATLNGTFTTHFMNYANATTYKTYLTRNSGANIEAGAYVGLWRSTAAITQLVVGIQSPQFWVSGTTMTLYGILAA